MSSRTRQDGVRLRAKRQARIAEADDWQADYESHARWQMTAALAATPAQRLAWLESMRALAFRSGALPRPDED